MADAADENHSMQQREQRNVDLFDFAVLLLIPSDPRSISFCNYGQLFVFQQKRRYCNERQTGKSLQLHRKLLFRFCSVTDFSAGWGLQGDIQLSMADEKTEGEFDAQMKQYANIKECTYQPHSF